MRRWLLLTALVPFAQPLFADKVILKDGKIYEGRIMGETPTSVLLSPAGSDTPKFIPMNEVMTLVREKNPDVPNPDRDRHAHLELVMAGAFPSSGQMELDAHPRLEANGGFRLFPQLLVEAGIDWAPDAGGALALSDGTTTREYACFSRWSGGFGIRVYPFTRKWKPDWETSLIGRYRWTGLSMKDSGDHLSGEAWQAGLGVARKLGKMLYWESRALYEQSVYDDVQFLHRSGTLRQDIRIRAWLIQTGISIRI